MSARLERFLTTLLTHRVRVLGLATLTAAALAPGLLRLETDNSPRIFFVEGSPAVERYERFQERFGDDLVVRLAVSGERLWTAEGLGALGRLSTAAAAIPGVTAVSDLAGHYRRLTGSWPPGDPEAFRRRAVGDLLAARLGWLSRDGGTATLLIALEPLDARARSALLDRLERMLQRERALAEAGLCARLVGIPVLDRALDASSREVERRYFPLLIAFSVLLLGLAFRRPEAVLAPLAFVALAEVLLLGTMGYLGVKLNLVLVILPPLLFVIALATAVHVLAAFRGSQAQGREGAEAVIAAYRDKGWAVLWTGVSTAVGFASLVTSRVGPVASLGLWAGFGIAGMTLLAFVVLPPLLLAAHRRPGVSGERRFFERFLQHHGRRWAVGAAAKRRRVLAIAAALALLALAGIPRLRIETNALTYLPPDHPVRADIEALEAAGVGTATVELVLALPEGETFRTLAALDDLAELSGRLAEEPLALGAVSAGDLLADAVRHAPGGALFGAATTRQVAFDRLAREDGGAALTPLLSADGRRARVTVFTETVGYRRLQPLLASMRRAAREAFPAAEARTTGKLSLVLESQQQLLVTLGYSLTLTALAVAVILRLILGSTRLTLLAMLPNLWPVVGVIGVMGWVRVPLDVATVMVASVVLGLAVDDTIHTLGHFREEAPHKGKLEAVAGALERLAPAYVLTGVILVAGFGVCALSSFAPTARFGALSAIAILLAVAGDLVLLPAILGSTPRGVVDKLARRR